MAKAILTDQQVPDLQPKTKKKIQTDQDVLDKQPEDKPYEVHDSTCTGLLLRVETSGTKTWWMYLWTPDSSGKRQRYRHKIGQAGLDGGLRLFGKTAGSAADRARDVRSIAEGLRVQSREHDLREVRQAARAAAKAESHSTLGAFIDGPYLDYQVKKERRNPQDTCKYQKAAFRVLLDKRIDQIAYLDIKRWLLKADKTLKPGSIKRRLTFLSSVLNRAIIEGLIDSHPLQKKERERRETYIAIPKPQKGKLRFLSSAEEQSLRAALAARDAELKAQRARTIIHRQTRQQDAPAAINGPYGDHLTPLVLLALNTGIRKGALLGLKWSDISDSEVSVREELDKAGSGYAVALSAEAKEVLRLWKRQTNGKADEVIFRYHGLAMSHVKSSWSSVLESAQVENFRFHDLRHSFASKLVMAGVPLFTVSQLLGHHSLETTMIYAHLSPDHMADALKALNGGVK